MKYPLKETDYFQGLEVTKVSDSYCFFGKKRISWIKINNLIAAGEKIQHRVSPNKIVDWTKKEEVVEYHNCFKFWNTYLSGYSDRFTIHRGILEVKNGLVLFNGEYYLPSPVSKWEGQQNWWNAKQENIKDGFYNVSLMKQENDWYPKENADRGNIILNMFLLGSVVKSSISELKPNSEELWASQYNGGINFTYSHGVWDGLSFDLTTIDSVKLFRKYFVNHRWGNDINIEISDAKIRELMFPIESKIADVVRKALSNSDFYIDIDESYGELSVPNMLQFKKPVASEIFGIITNQLNKTT